MKKDVKQLLAEMGRALRKSRAIVPDFERCSTLFAHHHINLSAQSLHRLWMVIKGHRHLSAETRDRLALLAGFQSWNDLEDALHGDTDGLNNFKD